MLLTSYERLRRYLGDNSNIGGLTDSSMNKSLLLTWAYSISDRVEKYLHRSIETTSRTKYFDVGYNVHEFWVQGIPVSSITSVKLDASGLFSGDESTLSTSDEYYIGTESNSVVLVSNPFRTSQVINRGVQIVYTGGLATNGTYSVFAVASVTSWAVGNFCIGVTSNTVGIVRAVGAASLTVEVLYGVFEVGETIEQYATENRVAAATASTTLSSKTSTALCESHPAITGAVEVEIRYMWKHKHDFEDDSTQRDGTTGRRPSAAKPNLQPETRMLLEPYIKPVL